MHSFHWKIFQLKADIICVQTFLTLIFPDEMFFVSLLLFHQLQKEKTVFNKEKVISETSRKEVLEMFRTLFGYLIV